MLIQKINAAGEGGAEVIFKNASYTDLCEIEKLGGSIKEKNQQEPSELDHGAKFSRGVVTFKDYDEAKKAIEILRAKKFIIHSPSLYTKGGDTAKVRVVYS